MVVSFSKRPDVHPSDPKLLLPSHENISWTAAAMASLVLEATPEDLALLVAKGGSVDRPGEGSWCFFLVFGWWFGSSRWWKASNKRLLQSIQKYRKSSSKSPRFLSNSCFLQVFPHFFQVWRRSGSTKHVPLKASWQGSGRLRRWKSLWESPSWKRPGVANSLEQHWRHSQWLWQWLWLGLLEVLFCFCFGIPEYPSPILKRCAADSINEEILRPEGSPSHYIMYYNVNISLLLCQRVTPAYVII